MPDLPQPRFLRPRANAEQREDYLIKAFGEYKAGRRVGAQAVMIEAVAGLSDEQFADLAYTLSRAMKGVPLGHEARSPGQFERTDPATSFLSAPSCVALVRVV